VAHHSLRTAEQSSPWSLGFEVEIPLSAASRKDAIRNRYDALARAADLRIGAAAWEVRARVRARLLDVYANALETELLQNEVREREAMLTLLEQRLEAGAVSSVEVNSARLAAADARSRLQVTRSAGARDLAALAEALSLPLPLVRSMQLDYAELQQTAPPLQDLEMRRAALLNRLDIRGKLLEYAAAEADVRLEIARQYPTIALSPGFFWDQSDNIWSLAATLVPAVAGNRPAIAAAQARREVEASQFRALQDRVITQAQGAEAAYASLAQALTQAEQVNALHLNRVQQVERRFAAGSADRVELTAARLEMLIAQRTAFALRVEALHAQGALEDALQIPLTGGPLPQLAQTAPDAATGLAQQ
jgi:outer membrane protein TolC